MLEGSPTHTRGAIAPPGFLLVRAWTGRRRGPVSLRGTGTAAASLARLGILLAAIIALTPEAARPQGEHPITKIVVTGKRLSGPERTAPTTFFTSIDPSLRDLEVETLTDALADTVGVRVRRFGGLGDFSTLSIRGSSSNQTLIFLDGVRLSRARNESFNLADLPLESLERVEVYRSTIPATFGAGATGGVVNLVTRRPSPEPAAHLIVSYGSFETRKVAATYTQELGGFDLLGFVTYLGSEGDFTFEDDNGTPENPHDDETVKRKNNDFNSVEVLLKAGYTLANGLRLDLTSETFYKDEGVPGIGSFQSESARQDTLRALNYLQLTPDALLPEDWEGQLTLFGLYQQDHFVDLGSDDRGGADLGFLKQDRDDQTVLVGGSASATYYAPLAQALTAFTELSYERFVGRNDAATARSKEQPPQSRLQFSLNAEDAIDPFDGLFVVVPALRYQHLHDSVSDTFDAANLPTGGGEIRDEDLFSPSIGAESRPFAWLSIKGNIGLFRRAPNLLELFGLSGNVRGNPDLQPEKSLNRDVGFLLGQRFTGIGDLHLEFSYFNNDADDLIVLVQTSPNFFTPRNIGAARLRGEEVTLGATLRDHLTVNANYTHQDAENRSDNPNLRGNQLPGQPENQLYTRVELFNRALRAYYEFNFVGANFTDQVNLRRIPSRDIHTIGIAWRAPRWVTLNFEARNFTDNQVSDIGGFPLPGRSFFGTVKLDAP